MLAGYVVQAPESDLYRFGPAAVVLGQSARDTLGFSVAMPLLEQLGGETGESVNMGILDGHEVVVILRVESVQPLRFDQPTGTRIRMHCSSMGKSLLAFSDEVSTSDLSLDPIGPGTITDPWALEEDLNGIRERGFALDHEESLPGLSCVGAPVLDGNGRAVAAIAVQGPTVRMTTERMAHLGRRVAEVANAISDAMHLRDHQ